MRTTRQRLPILAYHGFVRGDESGFPVGWSPEHTVSYFSLWAQLDFLSDCGWQAVALNATDKAGKDAPSAPISFTFDDGHASDSIAAEALARHGFTGTFFIPWSHIDREGYLERSALLELARGHFHIGSHSLHHESLSGRTQVELECELVESKYRLEDLIGSEITDLAVPFGRYDKRVIAVALAAGYRRILTSDVGIARIGPAAVLPRLPITSHTTFEDFCTLISATPLTLMARRLRRGATRRIEMLRRTFFQPDRQPA